MFFLPLPLEKTAKTLEEVEKKPAGLPDPELYISVNSKLTKIWQSLINVEELKATLRKLRDINWLYTDVGENSLDDASRCIIENVSNTMLKRVSAEDVSSYQSYNLSTVFQSVRGSKSK